MLGNEEDFTTALGFAVASVDDHLSQLDSGALPQHDEAGVREISNLKVVATTFGWHGLRLAMTGVQSVTRVASFLKRDRCPSWKSTIAVGAGTRLLRA